MDERDWTTLYRRVKNKPQYFKDGRLASSIFKDSNGVSVNRDLGRSEEEIIEEEERLNAFYNRHLTDDEIREKGENLRAIISITDEICDKTKVYVVPDPIEGENLYHALILRSESESKKELTKQQARDLVRAAKIVKTYS